MNKDILLVSPGLHLEIDYSADSEPVFCLLATDAENQKVIIAWAEMPYLIEKMTLAYEKAQQVKGGPPCGDSQGSPMLPGLE